MTQSDSNDRGRITTQEQAKVAADALVALSLTGHPDRALEAGWAAAALFISRQFLAQVLMRRFLSRRTSPG